MTFSRKSSAVRSFNYFKSLLVLCAFAGFSSSAVAAVVTINSVTGASNSILTSETPIIYGAIAGTYSGSCTLSTTEFCKTCTGSTACSNYRIHPNLNLTITFTVTGDKTGKGRLLYSSSGTITEFPSYSISNTSSLAKNSSATITVAWGDVCTYVIGDSNCDTSLITGNLYIALTDDTTFSSDEYTTINVRAFKPEDATSIDSITCSASPAQDGLCDFVGFPGDEKIYITDPQSSGDYPSTNSVPFVSARVFYVPTGNTINYQTATYEDLTIEDSGDLTPNKVSNLENNVAYDLAIAMVDAAQNVAYLTATETNITPSNVLGIFNDDINCFIATASYGSSFAKKVKDFRKFRNQILQRSHFGKSFIRWYYQVGPKGAQWLNLHPEMKGLARAMLFPAWAFANVATWLNSFFWASVLVLSIFMGMIALFFQRRFAVSEAPTSNEVKK